MIKGADAADHPAVVSGDRKKLDKLLEDLKRAPRWRPRALEGIFTAEELMAEDMPPVRWVVPQVLPEGVTLLAGKPKVGKSWMALAISLAVASGGPVFGNTGGKEN
jgi:replication-associated recombination protein RarA